MTGGPDLVMLRGYYQVVTWGFLLVGSSGDHVASCISNLELLHSKPVIPSFFFQEPPKDMFFVGAFERRDLGLRRLLYLHSAL